MAVRQCALFCHSGDAECLGASIAVDFSPADVEGVGLRARRIGEAQRPRQRAPDEIYLQEMPTTITIGIVQQAPCDMQAQRSYKAARRPPLLVTHPPSLPPLVHSPSLNHGESP